MKKYILLATLAMASMPLLAQETYENANLATGDLNGTARYVGMGGAMEALGGDISVIETNPAGIGVFRRSNISMTLGMVSQEGAQDFGGGHTTNFSFDQIGFVWANRISSTNFVNFGFNYHKSRNFNQILSAANRLDNASQSKATKTKNDKGILYDTYMDKNGNVVPDFDYSFSSCTILDDLYARNLNYDSGSNTWNYFNGEEYVFDRYQTGYISQFDFNLSGSVNYRFMWGLTLGIHDVHYSRYTEYGENLIGGYGVLPVDLGVTITDDRIITGTGASLSGGVIFMPVEDLPLRFGVSISTPTFYDLKSSSYTTYEDNTGWSDATEDEYDFKLNTPWKFGLSAGHVVNNSLALGLSYELSDYRNLDSRVNVDGDWDDYSSSESDKVMNRHTDATLKAVHTLKAGLEFKPAPEVSMRLGYNYVSPMYQKEGYKDTWLDSPGSYHSSTTDFTNWEATHRITCGLGLNLDNWFLSAAYQYSVQKGNFAPFDFYYDPEDAAYDNITDLVKVDNKRHQVMFTAAYSF